MPLSLQEYVEHLDQQDVLWPKPPAVQDAKATPFVKPLPDIRAVLWCVYGTLVRIADGKLLHQHPQQLRMQTALEKTIQEFNMWNSMYRTPEAPWEYMLRQYAKVCEDLGMAGNIRKGDAPEIDSAVVWRRLVDQLLEKEYTYDVATYGDLDEFCVKIAYFFHASLQGIEAAPHALAAIEAVRAAGCVQGLLADAQPFTLVQMLRALKQQGEIPSWGALFDASCITFSYQAGVRKPSPTLYQTALKAFDRQGIAPAEILYIGSRLPGDLAVAKGFGMRTALYAADKISLQARQADMKDPAIRPDRLLTNLASIRDILRSG
jgi:FMN phosphatase YigB (HAD superfamily)